MDTCGMQNMATSSTPRTGKTPDSKVSIWLFQLPICSSSFSGWRHAS